MEIMTGYNDLLRKIDILETQLELVDAELTYWFGGESLIFSGKGTAKFGMTAAIGNIESIHDRKHKIAKMLEFYKEVEKEIKTNIDQLEGLPYQIARMRFLEDMTYQEIADKLGLTYGYIRQIVSKSNKERTAILEKA